MNEIIFIVEDAPEGGFIARAVGQSIFTQAADWFELEENIIVAVEIHFEEGAAPKRIRIQYKDTRLTLKTDPHQEEVIAPGTLTAEDAPPQPKDAYTTAAGEIPEAPPEHPWPAKQASILLRIFGSMLAGALVGTVTFYLLFNIASSDGGGLIVIGIFGIPVGIALSGFVTGILLSSSCPKAVHLQPMQLFVYSPVLLQATILLMMNVHSEGVKAIKEWISSPILFSFIIAMFISWVGASIGWGLYPLKAER